MATSVWLYRPDLTRQVVIVPAWEADAGYRLIALDLELRENSVTELTLVMPYATAPPLDWFPLDALLGVWQDGRLEGETLWFVRVPPALSYGANGELVVTVRCRHALYLLEGRIVAYAAGSSQTEKTGPGDDLIKAVVRENLGSSAGARALSNLSVAPDLGQGTTVYKTFPRRNVFLVCRELARASAQGGTSIFFDLVWTGSALEFRTYLGQRGVDHSRRGIAPVMLSQEFGSLAEVTRQFDHRDEVTVVYCGGQGTEDQRLVVSVSDTDRLAASPWNRREMWVDARYLALQDSLTTEADGALWRRRPRQTLRGIAVSQPGAAYGTHWAFGDLVSAEIDGDVVTARVHAVQIRVADGVRLVRAELRADSIDSEDAIRQIEGVLDSSNAEEFPPWSETPAAYTLPLAGAGGTLAAGWLPSLASNYTGTLPPARGGTGVSNAYNLTIPATGTAALRSGSPTTGRVASWASATALGDAGFAVSDVARLSQFPSMAVRKTAIQGGFAPATFKKITFDTIDSGTFDTANSRWTPGIAGTYLVVASIQIDDPTEDGKLVVFSAFRSGSRYRDYVYACTGTATQGAPVVFMFDVSASDYIELFANPFNWSGTMAIFGSAAQTSWSCARIV